MFDKRIGTLLLVVVAVVALMGVVAGVAYWVAAGAAARQSQGQASTGTGLRGTFAVGKIVSNLAPDRNGDLHYVQLQIQLELSERRVSRELGSRLALVKHRIIGVLQQRSPEELRGGAGMDRLSSDILQAVNQVLTTGQVVGVYFEEFLID